MSSTPVLDLLADEGRWCKGEMFQDGQGNPCSRSEAKAYTIYGALFKYYHPGHLLEAREKICGAILKLYGVPEFIEVWNDAPTTTHAMVVAVLREAGV